ncbi:MAG: YgiQ family radical SAM protein [Candidatus Cloacimonetes bacterium]|nr:YgiQ family radical SAM protein [Candidatus Cloacimonadota bacterium]
MTKAGLDSLKWERPDIVLISGDAYIDHPSFGTALIGRVLEAAGFRVGIIAQPDWKDPGSVLALGIPRLFFGVSAGNMDSMVNHYTAQKKLRHDDAYSPEGKSGLRPDRATLIYCNLIRQAGKNIPIVIGGIEASLRRIAHYDFWSDKIRNSILPDAKADILVYGMAEKAIVQIARDLDSGLIIQELSDIPGTVCMVKEPSTPDPLFLPDSNACKDKATFLKMTRLFISNHQNRVLYQNCGGRLIRHNPPQAALSSEELDAIYALPFVRKPHPLYQGKNIPAFVQIRESITSHRGCFGGCNFCAIGVHQGRRIQSRSESSILSEISQLAKMKDFNGIISDVGGPTANMYLSECALGFPESCKRLSCLFPGICSNLRSGQKQQLKLLSRAQSLPGVKRIFVSSGIRHDLALSDDSYIETLASEYVSGRLKLAPEHFQNKVLKLMGKPEIELYNSFCDRFYAVCKAKSLKREIIPYIIIGHPGTSLQDAISLGLELKRKNIRLTQVQEFTPTPMTISTCMYYTGLDFESGKPIEIPKGRQIRLQKAFVFWYDPEYKKYILEALISINRKDIIKEFFPI